MWLIVAKRESFGRRGLPKRHIAQVLLVWIFNMSEQIEQSVDQPLRRINSVAPIRICDNGGWTDTWFAGHGKIFNMAVAPCVEVQIAVYSRADRPARVILNAENYGDRYALAPGAWSEARAIAARHPLLEAAVAEMAPPEEYALEITIYSAVPAGCSTGTSAAVTVALLGALDALTPGRMTPHEIAYAAHRIEVERLN